MQIKDDYLDIDDFTPESPSKQKKCKQKKY